MTSNPFQGQLVDARKRIFSDIRFWLIILSLVRLYGITNPPLEFQHAWRQADGLMIARNFLETDSNIFYPRVDIAGDKTGITGSEFPILYYLIYLVSLVFSYQPWYGRVIVLIFSTLGSFYFYKSIKKFFGETVAFNAAIILTCSLWFSFSRKVFPDCFAAGLCLMALYFVLTYLENGKWSYLLLYLFLGSIGCLSKISFTLILSVLAIPVIYGQYPRTRKLWMMACSGVILLLVAGWYFWWAVYLNETFGYGNHFTMGCPLLSQGWEEIKATWPLVLRRIFIFPMKYLGILIFGASLIYVLARKQWTIFALFIIPYLCFLFIILKTGKNIVMDQYYVLSAIPAMALISGYGLAQIANKKIMLVLLTATAVESMGDQIRDFRVHKTNAAFRDLESIVDSVSNRSDLFVVNTEPHCPTAMYFAHRKGWTVNRMRISDTSFLGELKSKNCKFALVVKRMYGFDNDVTLSLPQVYESDDYRIYSLE
jgi:4-amino-4-deoxy-L-arabinose transferase-like glycosyltransferase